MNLQSYRFSSLGYFDSHQIQYVVIDPLHPVNFHYPKQSHMQQRFRLLRMLRSPGLKKALEEDLTDERSKLHKHRDALEALLSRDEVRVSGIWVYDANKYFNITCH